MSREKLGAATLLLLMINIGLLLPVVILALTQTQVANRFYTHVLFRLI